MKVAQLGQPSLEHTAGADRHLKLRWLWESRNARTTMQMLWCTWGVKPGGAAFSSVTLGSVLYVWCQWMSLSPSGVLSGLASRYDKTERWSESNGQWRRHHPKKGFSLYEALKKERMEWICSPTFSFAPVDLKKTPGRSEPRDFYNSQTGASRRSTRRVSNQELPLTLWSLDDLIFSKTATVDLPPDLKFWSFSLVHVAEEQPWGHILKNFKSALEPLLQTCSAGAVEVAAGERTFPNGRVSFLDEFHSLSTKGGGTNTFQRQG